MKKEPKICILRLKDESEQFAFEIHIENSLHLNPF